MGTASKARAKAPRYTTDLLKTPGMSFDTDIESPKERIQKYIDAYRNSQAGDFQVSHTWVRSMSLWEMMPSHDLEGLVRGILHDS